MAGPEVALPPVTAADTTEAADAVLVAVWRRMTGEQRLAAALEMCDDVREISRDGIRARHPDYSPAEVEHALHRLLLGDALSDKVWPQHRRLLP